MRLRLVLDVEVDDVQRFVVDPEHVARVHGWVVCPALGTLAVEQGIFNVLVDDAGEKQMRYELQASAADGSQLRVSGIKHVRPGRLSSVWADTTTLFTAARLGGLDWADGVLRVSLPGFLRQLSTFRAQAPTAAARAGALTGFVTFFLSRLWAVYGPQPPPSALPAAWLHEAGAP